MVTKYHFQIEQFVPTRKKIIFQGATLQRNNEIQNQSNLGGLRKDRKQLEKELSCWICFIKLDGSGSSGFDSFLHLCSGKMQNFWQLKSRHKWPNKFIFIVLKHHNPKNYQRAAIRKSSAASLKFQPRLEFLACWLLLYCTEPDNDLLPTLKQNKSEVEVVFICIFTINLHISFLVFFLITHFL